MSLVALLLAAAAATAQPAPAPAASATAPLSVDAPIETIAATPAGKAVLQSDVPGLLDHPAYDSFKSMSLKDVQPMSEGKITDAMLAKAAADLAKIKPS